MINKKNESTDIFHNNDHWKVGFERSGSHLDHGNKVLKIDTEKDRPVKIPNLVSYADVSLLRNLVEYRHFPQRVYNANNVIHSISTAQKQ